MPRALNVRLEASKVFPRVRNANIAGRRPKGKVGDSRRGQCRKYAAMSSPFACSSFRFLRREQLLMMASCLFQCKAGTGRRRSFAAAAAKAGRSARLVSSSMIALARWLLCRFRNAYAFQRKWRALPRMPKALPFRRVHACYSVSLAPAFSAPFKRMILGHCSARAEKHG